jgi:hypothetical protein
MEGFYWRRYDIVFGAASTRLGSRPWELRNISFVRTADRNYNHKYRFHDPNQCDDAFAFESRTRTLATGIKDYFRSVQSGIATENPYYTQSIPPSAPFMQ